MDRITKQEVADAVMMSIAGDVLGIPVAHTGLELRGTTWDWQTQTLNVHVANDEGELSLVQLRVSVAD